MFKRSAGVLLHITSLPSSYGNGTLGKEAYEFVDFLSKAGQKYWQILPIGPTDGPISNCPYSSFSTHAGNPYLIDLETLKNDGLLEKNEYTNLNWGDNPEWIDYDKICNLKLCLLEKAYVNSKNFSQKKFEEFIDKNREWLEDYALYMALKEHFSQPNWRKWPEKDIAQREPESMKYYRQKLEDRLYFFMYTQFLFFTQWKKFKKYANDHGILLIGDIPIYVSMGSADTWANSKVFWFDKQGDPVCVGGCPPDQFSDEGQLWNAPLYNWDYLAKTDYSWWVNRFKSAISLFDVTRIDHFRAFHSYYAIQYLAKDAINGEWLKGPGMKFFEVLKEKFGNIPLIAEDFGGPYEEGVKKLLKDTGCPGMKILQYAFDFSCDNENIPHNYDKNSVVYTGNHDNDTISGWLASAAPAPVSRAKVYSLLSKEEGYNWGLIRLAYSSVSDLAIIPVQDFLNLGTKSRMNIPGTIENNWRWKLKDFSKIFAMADKIYNLSKIYGRVER
ncbi:MAG: 4-alpha-glucanotransferase [Oscillospiraceae bacterium]|nr:4-alpha-glucanotransferase [Oscillospiraceae bacterium]